MNHQLIQIRSTPNQLWRKADHLERFASVELLVGHTAPYRISTRAPVIVISDRLSDPPQQNPRKENARTKTTVTTIPIIAIIAMGPAAAHPIEKNSLNNPLIHSENPVSSSLRVSFSLPCLIRTEALLRRFTVCGVVFELRQDSDRPFLPLDQRSWRWRHHCRN